jgi:hypothetical protein
MIGLDQRYISRFGYVGIEASPTGAEAVLP